MTERTIFLAALDIDDPVERVAYVERACGDDSGLRCQVEGLLTAHRRPSEFMARPAPALVTVELPPAAETPGATVGPYKLLEEIGEGGFGVIYVAEQTAPLRRKVALKVLKPGMDSRAVVARFEAERQALALMDHPNIARVFDGGATASGRPYFVMELVKGVPITAFCDQNQLTPRQRLELFVQVCGAVQHAHQKGIIHRDLKPSNVLVSRHDTTPVVKVIDFGVAKALGQALTDKTLFTGVAQLIGTPLYMSPEQAGMSDLDVDTRSDVYALGVLLYELLTGTTPFDKERFQTVGYDEMRRIIREEEPQKPSTRLSTRGLDAQTVSSNRATEPRKLSALVRGELDWIVMKALEKDRTRRYETVGAFAADVRRYLTDEPVQACPPSSWYRFRKFARRNRRMLVTGGTIAAALVLAVASLLGAVTVLAASYEESKEKQKQTQKALDGEKRAKDELLDGLKRERHALYLKSLALAERELAANNIGRLEEILDGCPLELRGWEWHYLRRGRGPFTFRGHGSWVMGFAFSPDGKQVASADKTGEIKVWQPATGNVLHRLLGHVAPAFAVAFHPGGKHLASAGWDHTVRIWDLETGKQVSSLTEHREFVTSVAYSPDGKLLATAGGGDAIIIWDAVTLQKLRALPGARAILTRVAFAPDSRRLASASYGDTIRLWDADTGERLYEMGGVAGLFERVAFSGDGKTMLSAEFDGTVRFWDAATCQHRATIRTSPGNVGMALSPDGHRLATGGFEGFVTLWDMQTRQETLVLRGHTDQVHELAFSPDGVRLASTSMDGTVKIWDAGTAATRADAAAVTLRGHGGAVNSVAFHPDSKRLATGSFDETVKLWNATTGAELGVLPVRVGIVARVVLSQDGRTLAAAGYGGVIKIWDLETGKEGRTFHGSAYALALSPDGKRVAAAVDGRNLCVWDVATGREELPPFLAYSAPIQGLTFSPDGQQLATFSYDATAVLWNATTGRKLHTFSGHSHVVMDAVFSADGKRLATASLDKTAKVWDVGSGKELLTLRGHDDRVLGVAFSPDGKRLATASLDNTAKVWDAATGKELDTLRGHSGCVCGVAFSPDGKWLASAGGHRTRGEV
jgi:WD40 repeat protein/serine/threonine protein kinase